MTMIDLADQTGEPLSLADLKQWCRIDRDDEDALLEALIRAARLAVEAATGLVLARRSFRLCLDPVPPDGWVEIARRPLRAVSEIVAYDASGTAVSFVPGEAVIERALGIEAIRLSPAVRQASANGAEIVFVAGFDPGKEPDDVKLALRRIAAASYELRAAVPLEGQPAIIPPLAKALIAPYRRVRI